MPMKNIVAIVGSNHKNSRTNRLIKMWLNRMSELDDTIHYKIFWLREFKVKMCEGCNSCFYNGLCTLDQNDDMLFLREKMFESNIIIFSSPVYMHNMSGIMKNFIDRMAFDSHTFHLSGKFGFTLTTTDSSGGETVSNMLQQMQTCLGIKNINNFIYAAAYDNEITSCNKWAKISLEELSSQLGFSDPRLEEQFLYLKKHYSIREIDDSRFWSEIRFWQQPAVQQCLSFQEFAVKYKYFYQPKVIE